MEAREKTLKQLFVPICLETILYMLAGMVDTLMLSSVSDQVVGAVGTSNTYIGMFIIMFSIVTSGMTAVMTQYIGADKPGIAYQARQIGIVFNLILGTVLSAVMYFFADGILNVVGVADALKKPATDYMKIVGGGAVLNALIPVFSGYLRSFGYTKQPLIATVIGNVINLILNAVFLYGCGWGVKGVAYATVISRIVNLTIVMLESHFLIKAAEDGNRLAGGKIIGQIVKIGLPSAMESILYNVAITIVFKFLNQMDAEGVNVTARSYATQITNFSFSAGSALAQANAIMTGWRIGEGRYDECDRKTNKAALTGIAVAIAIESLFAICSGFLIRIFTDDPAMISLVGKLLAIDIVLEAGRVSNLVYGNALKTAGDAVFPAVIAAVFMFMFAVGGTYVFGIKLNLMVTGAYIGLTMDECVRAAGMFLRWKSGKWKKMTLVSR